MTTPPERYADLIGLVADDDPAMERAITQLDRALRTLPAPLQLRAALEQSLQQRLSASQSSSGTARWAASPVSRRAALKTGAASFAWLLTLGHTSPAVARELAQLAQEGPMTGLRLAGILQTERRQWNALLAQVGPSRMETPGVDGTWSMKELVAHLTWYERAVVEGARQVLGTGTYTRSDSGLAGLGMDERNARIAAESRGRSAAEVLAEAERVFDQLVAVIAACPEALLNDPRRLGLPEDRIPWMLVADNAYAHYRQHEEAVRAWLTRVGTNSQAGATPSGKEEG